MTTTNASDRFTTLPDDQTLADTVVALEEHGFSVEVVDDLDAGPQLFSHGGPATGRVILEYGDYECPYSRQAFREDDDLQRYAAELELDGARLDQDRLSRNVLRRIRRDVESGRASGEVRGTPTLFIDGVVHRGGYTAATLLQALAA